MKARAAPPAQACRGSEGRQRYLCAKVPSLRTCAQPAITGSIKEFPTATFPVLALRVLWLQALKRKKIVQDFFQSQWGFRASKSQRENGC